MIIDAIVALVATQILFSLEVADGFNIDRDSTRRNRSSGLAAFGNRIDFVKLELDWRF